MPKYGLLKMPPVTVPLSGTGVTESLALDQAPLTRMNPVGTFVAGCRLLEKSPPFFGSFCGRVSWPQPGKDKRTIKNRKNPQRIFLPSNLCSFVCSGRQNKSFPTRNALARRLRVSPRASQNAYSERRKFSKSCCWLVERLSKFPSTVDASLPLLS